MTFFRLLSSIFGLFTMFFSGLAAGAGVLGILALPILWLYGVITNDPIFPRFPLEPFVYSIFLFVGAVFIGKIGELFTNIGI